MIELPIIDSAEANAEKPRERFWRSVSHLKNDPEFQALTRSEFMPGAADAPGGASRREFLQIMGASMALAGLTACRRPVQKILPYSRKPEDLIEGIPMYYATAMPFRGSVRGLVVQSHEGRPTKVEGNPEHPASQGATSVFEQASILELYDPDRSQVVLHEGAASTWRDFVRFAQQLGAGAASKRVAVLAAPSSSPTQAALRRQLAQRFPSLRWVTYAAEGEDAARLGMQEAFGRPLRPQYRFSEADVIVSLDADFLGPTDPNVVANTRQFAASRRLDGPGAKMSRLYAVESAFTLTGGMADNRLRLRASEIPHFAAALAARLGVGGGGGSALADHPFVAAVADDLRSAGGRGVVVAGETQPPAVHALCAAINGALGSIGGAMQLFDTGEEAAPPQAEQLVALVEAMRAGQVDALIMLNVNPVYSAPAALGFAEAMQRVTDTVHLGLYLDETGQLSRWHLPRAHYLEAWGDGRAYSGTLSVIQPLIAPLYEDAHSEIEALAVLATGLEASGYDLVRETWRGQLSGNFEKAWKQVLHDGFVPETGYPAVSPAAAAPALGTLPVAGVDDLEVVFRLDYCTLDGSFSNNAWMQELPDPTTKIVWDNVAVMSRATAEALDLEVEYSEGSYYVDVIELSLGGLSVELPVWVLPGHPDGSISVSLGYGRDLKTSRSPRKARFFDTDAHSDVYARGPLANGVGVNVAPLRSALMERIALGAQVRKTGATHKIATTQEHGTMEGRPLVRMTTVDEYRAHPDFAIAEVPALPNAEPWEEYPALWEENHPSDQVGYKDSLYYKNQWGMVIDLNACTGCNACVVACNSENNIQMVGKEEVSRGREMHWLRVDRYFAGTEDDLDDPKMVVQPVPCMHCENAPCESVCPVAATVHSPDGLNEMVYNRCIGTRYCSNNCPYKVRRYNFFNWAKTMPPQVEMAMNPRVTVRFRGVMEKCTYCVQRIRSVQRRANVEERGIRDGEVLTACQQVCPAEAITFGDINDPTSAVGKAKRDPRRYEMLAELSVKPRTSYLGRVTNPNPRLA